MDKSEQIWNVLLHYAQPLTDDPESENVIMSDDLKEVHKDIISIIEGKDVQLPKPKEVRPRRSVEREVPEVSKVEEAIFEPGKSYGFVSEDQPKKPWWKVW